MNSFRLRVGAVCRESDSVLLVEHEKEGARYWLLPGGGLRVGESMKDALVREVMEETSMEVKAGNLLCVCESISPDKNRHIVHVLYETIRVSGFPGASRDARVRRSVFLPIKELEGIVLHPPIQEWLQRCLTHGFSNTPEYLGAMWI
jgi:ADP-ribose pyrophosphatase YjhB (NUDIX family)